jgi:hypothetical protein
MLKMLPFTLPRAAGALKQNSLEGFSLSGYKSTFEWLGDQ